MLESCLETQILLYLHQIKSYSDVLILPLLQERGPAPSWEAAKGPEAALRGASGPPDMPAEDEGHVASGSGSRGTIR